MSIYVSQTCPDVHVPIQTANVYIESGSLFVTDEGLPAQRFALDPRANPDGISARYEEGTSTLKITIPLRGPEKRFIPIDFVVTKDKDTPAVVEAESEEAVKQKAEEDAKREEFVRTSVETLERELERIKGHINTPPKGPSEL